MALVAYSDSEGSEDERPQTKPEKSTTKPAATSKFAVNKANPRKIQVKLQDVPTNAHTDAEPAAKRPRLGGAAGAFSGFNAMLPPPKRDADAKVTPKIAARKVFSLKTGAEPGFSRESDVELRHLFAEQEGNGGMDVDVDETIPSIPKSMITPAATTTNQPVQRHAFMFKPLSVARNKKQAKRKTDPSKSAMNAAQDGLSNAVPASDIHTPSQNTESAPPPKKVSLFSMTADPEPTIQPHPDEEDEIIESLDDRLDPDLSFAPPDLQPTIIPSHPQSLDSIATDLNLSKADRRQLFGRHGPKGGALNVVNFNTDAEYAANEVLRASGEQVQHNPVRGIAPGKHSLKQLVSAAQGQKEALEESFASGRRNKAEAGSRYGW